MPDPSAASDADFELGRAGLLEITAAETIGDPQGSIDEGEGVVTVYFGTNLAGYPGWRWTVSIAHVEGEQPTVLETELTPGDGALLSPAWIPWVDRLADYRAAQGEAGVVDGSADDADASEDESDESDDDDDDESDDDDDEDDESDDDDDDSDDDDDDDLGSDVLHGGDLDGVDIDDLDDDDEDDEDEDEDR
jgi:hypothetical protein